MLKKGIAKVFVSILLALSPVLANAIVITLEPDDFGAGVPLMNDYVTVAETDGYSFNEPTIVTAKGPYSSAPTGEFSFGVFALTPGLISQDGEVFRDWGGLLLRFNQEVSNVSLLANETPGDRPWWAGGTAWVAFDRDKNQIGAGSAWAPTDEPLDATYEVNIRRTGIWSVILGGAEGFRSTRYDHLTFEVDELPDVSVPEPGPLMLLLIGLAMITLRAKFRAQPE